jgi:hypothetical protein
MLGWQIAGPVDVEVLGGVTRPVAANEGVDLPFPAGLQPMELRGCPQRGDSVGSSHQDVAHGASEEGVALAGEPSQAACVADEDALADKM